MRDKDGLKLTCRIKDCYRSNRWRIVHFFSPRDFNVVCLSISYNFNVKIQIQDIKEEIFLNFPSHSLFLTRLLYHCIYQSIKAALLMVPSVTVLIILSSWISRFCPFNVGIKISSMYTSRHGKNNKRKYTRDTYSLKSHQYKNTQSCLFFQNLYDDWMCFLI